MRGCGIAWPPCAVGAKTTTVARRDPGLTSLYSSQHLQHACPDDRCATATGFHSWNVVRYAVGKAPTMLPKWRRRFASDRSPVASAIWVMVKSVRSRSSLARSILARRTHYIGVTPVSAVNRRENVRADTFAWRARAARRDRPGGGRVPRLAVLRESRTSLSVTRSANRTRSCGTSERRDTGRTDRASSTCEQLGTVT